MTRRVRTQTTARVQVTVEVDVGSWGTGCDMAQVYEQASSGAICKLRRLLEGQVKVIRIDSVQAVTTNVEVRP